jgi:hypothetical protein
MDNRTPAASPGSPERRAEANRLTTLMESVCPFTYLRLGDGELALLIEWQEGKMPKSVRDSESTKSIFRAYSVNGLKAQDYPRLLRAYEDCNYLDTFLRVPYSKDNYHRLRLIRHPLGVDSPSADLSQIFYEWAYCELPAYIKRHRCVFGGAEAPLLHELLLDPRYHKATAHYWNYPVELKCVGIRNNGGQYWEALDEIKRDLIEAVRESAADTLFLSLASGAKILCQEIARELRIRCFDLGAMSLALTFSATPGNSIARNSHSPFFFRVPFPVYMDCLVRAYPQLPTASVVAKGQAQLSFELLRKEPMNSFVPEIKQTSNFDPSATDMKNFYDSLQSYYERFGGFLRDTAEGHQLTTDFDSWCIERGLGIRGKMLMGKRYIMGVAARSKQRALNLVTKRTLAGD